MKENLQSVGKHFGRPKIYHHHTLGDNEAQCEVGEPLGTLIVKDLDHIRRASSHRDIQHQGSKTVHKGWIHTNVQQKTSPNCP